MTIGDQITPDYPEVGHGIHALPQLLCERRAFIENRKTSEESLTKVEPRVVPRIGRRLDDRWLRLHAGAPFQEAHPYLHAEEMARSDGSMSSLAFRQGKHVFTSSGGVRDLLMNVSSLQAIAVVSGPASPGAANPPGIQLPRPAGPEGSRS